MTSPSRRKELDVMKLMMNEYEVNVGEAAGEYFITFYGPKDSTFHCPSSGPYEGGKWRVRVELPPTYPFKSPSIGFTNRIYHPNVDEASGSVCLDVINQTWSPMFDLVNVFESFLPQLLLYPNPTDPLNGEAAALLLKEPEKYKAKVRDYVARFAADPNKGAKPAAVANGTSTTNGTKEKPDAEMSDPDDGDADIGSDGEGGGFFPK